MKNIAIIVAGGVGSRMGFEVPKQYLTVEDKPILYYTIQSFINDPHIHGIIMVIGESHRELYLDTIKLISKNKHKLLDYCIGGSRRSDSVYNGLLKAKGHNPTNILIHDGARPFVNGEIIASIIQTLESESHAVLVGVPVVDTLQYCNDNQVVKVIDRNNIWRAQTPQSFNYEMILQAYSSVLKNDSISLTDDISVWKEYYSNQNVKIITGSDNLFKVTVKNDLQKVENHLLLQRIKNNKPRR